MTDEKIKNKIMKEKPENRVQRLREILFSAGEAFRDKTMKEFGYQYNQSWLLFDENELSDLLDLYKEFNQKDERQKITGIIRQKIEEMKQEACSSHGVKSIDAIHESVHKDIIRVLQRLLDEIGDSK